MVLHRSQRVRYDNARSTSRGGAHLFPVTLAFIIKMYYNKNRIQFSHILP